MVETLLLHLSKHLGFLTQNENCFVMILEKLSPLDIVFFLFLTFDTSVICISGVLAIMLCEAHVTISFGNIAAQNKVKPHSLYVTTQNLPTYRAIYLNT